MRIDERLKTKRNDILQVAARHGAYNVRIFGSAARGEARPDSDVDILVNLEAGRTLLDHAALMIDLELLLGCDVDVATEDGLKPRIRDSVLRDAVPL